MLNIHNYWCSTEQSDCSLEKIIFSYISWCVFSTLAIFFRIMLCEIISIMMMPTYGGTYDCILIPEIL